MSGNRSPWPSCSLPAEQIWGMEIKELKKLGTKATFPCNIQLFYSTPHKIKQSKGYTRKPQTHSPQRLNINSNRNNSPANPYKQQQYSIISCRMKPNDKSNDQIIINCHLCHNYRIPMSVTFFSPFWELMPDCMPLLQRQIVKP